MKGQIKRLRVLSHKAAIVIKEDPKGFFWRGLRYTYYHFLPERRPKYINLKDVLFIDGTNVDFLVRYRVEHLMEQLLANGLTSDALYAGRLSLDLVRRYSCFVFYRCVPNDLIKEFVKQAKYFNKTCFFSIDDLVIDTEFTDSLEAVKSMNREQREEYDRGVRGYGNMMRLCSYSIATTEALAIAMKDKGSGQVHVNRNVVSQEMIHRSDTAIREARRAQDRITIGYFSGSSTHDVDFRMIAPALRKILKNYGHVSIRLVGRVTVPEELVDFSERVELMPYMEWRLLPSVMRECDINVAPLAESTLFNTAKSENKWAEAALVRTVTVASNIGAFKSQVVNGVTGILANNYEWYAKLKELIENPELREKIAANAYKEVRYNRTTLSEGGRALVRFLREKMAENVKFVIPSVDLSGGINIIFKHAEILREHGYDVTLISLDGQTDENRLNLLNRQHNVVVERTTAINQVVDKIVATHWTTFSYMKIYPNAVRKYYLVQGYESLIYPPGKIDRIFANATYSDKTGVQYITISPWCVSWLKKNFNQDARYAPNGLSLSMFSAAKRRYRGKVRILVEGNYSDPLKNIDAAFNITNTLDRDKFSVSYLSYSTRPKKDYIVDREYIRIEPSQLGKIYSDHDILLKTSLLESFSLPPLEMMATGGQVVLIKNSGNVEYVTEDNVVAIEDGDVEGGRGAIERIASSEKLRERMYKSGLDTVKRYDWPTVEDRVVALYT